MFPTNLDLFKTQENELHQRAAHYRLVKSLEGSNGWADRLSAAIGQLLIVAGQNLVKRTQVAH